jgi:AcrR family transcriptional regulator
MAATEATIDPRIRRTRVALFEALGALLGSRDFEKITVLDIAERANVNRATFYAHFPDKFALLEAMVALRFEQLLSERHVAYDCESALRAVILSVCDFLASTPRIECERQRQMEPHLESAVIAVVRRILLTGLEQSTAPLHVPREMAATTASWAIYGAAKEWLHTADRSASNDVVDTMTELISPLMHGAQPPAK